MAEDRIHEDETGSIVVALATDAPLSELSLRAPAKRAAIGIGRSGTIGGNSSGHIFIAFTRANPQPMSSRLEVARTVTYLNSGHLKPIYEAAVERIDEAVINALLAGEDVPSVHAHRICRAINVEPLRQLFSADQRA
ncbi:L-aminopeptidase/D-esterase-like protein [Bradyrhizobium sp. F1.13.3]